MYSTPYRIYAAWLALGVLCALVPARGDAAPRVVVPGAAQHYAPAVDQTVPGSPAVPGDGLIARSVGAGGVTGLTSAKTRADLVVSGYTSEVSGTRGPVATFNGAGRFGWELPQALVSSSTQVVNGAPQPYAMGLSFQYRHHLSDAQRVNGWAPILALGQFKQPWAIAVMLRNGVPVVAYKQKSGAFFDLGSDAVGHQPTLRIDDHQWHHVVINFWQPPKAGGCGAKAGAACNGRGLLRMFVDGALINEYYTDLTPNLRELTVGSLDVTSGNYTSQTNWQASPPRLLARGQVDDVALFRRALSSAEIAKLRHQADSGLVASWPEQHPSELGLTAATFPGAPGSPAQSPLTGFVATTKPIFFANPASAGTLTLNNTFPPSWDMVGAPGFTFAMTLQPNSQKWLYVRTESNGWFGFVRVSGFTFAVCGSGAWSYNSSDAGKFTASAVVTQSGDADWITIGVSHAAGKTRVYGPGGTVSSIQCGNLATIATGDYVRRDGEPAANPAKVARALLWRRALGPDEFAAEASPGPTAWGNPAAAAGTNIASQATGLLNGAWAGTAPAGAVINKDAAGVAQSVVYNLGGTALDPTLDGGADRPFTVAMRFRIDKVTAAGNVLLARRGQFNGAMHDFEMRALCQTADWNGCRIYILSPGETPGANSGQWRVDANLAWGVEHSVAVSWPANGIVEGTTAGTATAELQPRVAINGVLQNKVDKTTPSHVVDILPTWKWWGDHKRPTATGTWSWSFGGLYDGGNKLTLRDLRLYSYAVQAPEGIYARCATMVCGDAGQLCVDPDGNNQAASGMCHSCAPTHTMVGGTGAVDLECRPKGVFMDECVADGDCATGKCDTSIQRCLATDAATTETTCGGAAEGETMALACPAGSVIESVTYASYGNATGSCGAFANGSCHAANSVSKVEALCKGKTSCAVPVNNGTFGDPCSGTGKNLKVQVTCKAGKAGCDNYCFDRGRSCDAVGGGAYRCGNCTSGFKRLPGYDKLPAHHPGLECTWAPSKKEGELCANGAECISAVCGNSESEPTPYRVNAKVKYWNNNDFNNLADFDSIAIESSRPRTIKRCMGEDGKHCSKVSFTARPVQGMTPECKSVTAYDCNEQCDKPSRELRWTVLSPEACRDVLKWTTSKYPGTDILAYGYAVGWGYHKAAVNAFYDQNFNAKHLKLVFLRSDAPWNENVDVDLLNKAGVGRMLIEYAKTSPNSPARNALIAKYGTFGRIIDCNVNPGFTGAHNRLACEPKRQPIGAICPPPGEPLQQKHEFCKTNYCARDSKTCQNGDNPLLEPRPSAGNQDRQGKRDVKFGLIRLVDTTVEAEQTDKPVANQAKKYRYVADLTNAYCLRMFGAYVPPFPLLMSVFHLDRTKDEACAEYQFKAYVANKALTHGQPKALLGSCTGLKITNTTACSVGECQFGPLITGNLSELADTLLNSFTMTIGGAAPGCLPLEGTPVGELIDQLTILKTQTVGPIPLAVQFGPTLDICIDPLINMAATGLPKMTVRPSVGLGIDARGGIGVAEGKGKSKAIKFWAGVQLLLDIIKLGFPVGWGVDVTDVAVANPDPGELPFMWNLQISQRIGIDIEMFSGSFAIFAEVALGPFSFGFSVKLFEWTGLLWEIELSNVPLWSTKLDFSKPKVIQSDSLPDHNHSGWFSGQTCNGLCK